MSYLARLGKFWNCSAGCLQLHRCKAAALFNEIHNSETVHQTFSFTGNFLYMCSRRFARRLSTAAVQPANGFPWARGSLSPGAGVLMHYALLTNSGRWNA